MTVALAPIRPFPAAEVVARLETLRADLAEPLRNGQRALWSAIYCMAHSDNQFDEAFAFVERMTQQARHGTHLAAVS